MAESRRRAESATAVGSPTGGTSLSVGDDILERPPVANDKMATSLIKDAPVAPCGQLHAHPLTRRAEHARELRMGNADGLERRRSMVMRRGHQLLGQSPGEIQEGRVGNVLGGPPQARAQKLDDARHCLRPLPEKGQELTARNEEQAARIARHGRCGAPFAVQQGDLAEEFSRAEDVEDQLLAIHGVHGESDAARQDAVEAVAGIALLEEYAPSRNSPATRALQQLQFIPRRQRGEEKMKAEQVLSRHSGGTVEPWPDGSLAICGSQHKTGSTLAAVDGTYRVDSPW